MVERSLERIRMAVSSIVVKACAVSEDELREGFAIIDRGLEITDQAVV